MALEQTYTWDTSPRTGEPANVGGGTGGSKRTGTICERRPQRQGGDNLTNFKEKFGRQGMDVEAREVLSKSGNTPHLVLFCVNWGRYHLHKCVQIRDLGWCGFCNDDDIINRLRGKN